MDSPEIPDLSRLYLDDFAKESLLISTKNADQKEVVLEIISKEVIMADLSSVFELLGACGPDTFLSWSTIELAGLGFPVDIADPNNNIQVSHPSHQFVLHYPVFQIDSKDWVIASFPDEYESPLHIQISNTWDGVQLTIHTGWSSFETKGHPHCEWFGHIRNLMTLRGWEFHAKS